jgi:hypothetical protein
MRCFERLDGLFELTEAKDSACFTGESKYIILI